MSILVDAPRPHWAIVTDDPLDETEIAKLAVVQGNGFAAVMVPPSCLELTRSLVPATVRCVTHPVELEALGVSRCVVLNAEEVIARHGVALRSFVELVGAGPISTEPPQYDRGKPRTCSAT
jgi:hypothetical protein